MIELARHASPHGAIRILERPADGARMYMQAGALQTLAYADGTSLFHNVDHFRGTPGARVTDAMLGDLLAQYATAVLPEGRAAKIADAVWALDAAPDLSALTGLLRID